MSATREVPTWQLGIAMAGTTLFLLILTLANAIRTPHLAGGFGSGYVLGFVCVLVAFAFWEILEGRGRHFLNRRPVLLWLSYFPAAIVLIMAVLGLLANIFGGASWPYHLGWILGALAVAAGLVPALRTTAA